jgi:hypothetical protein
LAKTLSAADRERAEIYRLQRLEEAKAKWNGLTKDKEDWPEEEHQARFEALLEICLFKQGVK